jgi:hypothetical protein
VRRFFGNNVDAVDAAKEHERKLRALEEAKLGALEELRVAKERETNLLAEVEALKKQKQAAAYLDEAKSLPYVVA